MFVMGWIISDPNSHVEALMPTPHNVNFLENRATAEVLAKVRSFGVGWALRQLDWCPYARGHLDTDMYIWEMPCEDEGRDPSKNATDWQKTTRSQEGWMEKLSPHIHVKEQSCWTLMQTSRLQNFETIKYVV